MPGIGDWIGEPLSFVSNYLSQNSAAEYKEKVTNFFTKNISSSEECRQWIPSLNTLPLHEMKPDSLVKFRCMVQDMFGPEYYYDVFESENTSTGEKRLYSGRYRDVTSAADDSTILHNSAATKTLERHVFYCVPVPGETSWVKQGHKASCASPRVAGTSKSIANSKRTLDEENEEEAMETQADNEANKRTRTLDNGDSTAAQTNGTSSPAHNSYNFPLPGETGPAVLVKIYDDIGDTLKLNDIIEVYGVISTDPSLSQLNTEDCEMFSAEEQKAHHPPASLVPRLHAVYVRNLKSTNPLLSRPNTNLESVKSQAGEVREHLLSILEQALCGDSLSAEYLLCHLLSSVYIRRDMVAVGKLSLNLTKVPQTGSPLVSSLIELIEQFVTSLYYLPMSLDNMNKLSFTPVKDYEANRLMSGVLQLPDRTHLVLDETAMQPGQLDVNGVKNVTALGNLIRWQRVSYDFKFHQQDFSTDVPVLTLSEGKSLLPCDAVIPLQMNTELSLEARHSGIQTYLSPDLREQIQLYLTLIPTLDYEMSEDMTKVVQECFVSARRDNKDTMTAEDFQSLLVLSRILSISYGLTDLTPDIWAKAKHMEEQRKLRLLN